MKKKKSIWEFFIPKQFVTKAEVKCDQRYNTKKVKEALKSNFPYFNLMKIKGIVDPGTELR